MGRPRPASHVGQSPEQALASILTSQLCFGKSEARVHAGGNTSRFAQEKQASGEAAAGTWPSDTAAILTHAWAHMSSIAATLDMDISPSERAWAIEALVVHIDDLNEYAAKFAAGDLKTISKCAGKGDVALDQISPIGPALRKATADGLFTREGVRFVPKTYQLLSLCRHLCRRYLQVLHKAAGEIQDTSEQQSTLPWGGPPEAVRLGQGGPLLALTLLRRRASVFPSRPPIPSLLDFQCKVCSARTAVSGYWFKSWQGFPQVLDADVGRFFGLSGEGPTTPLTDEDAAAPKPKWTKTKTWPAPDLRAPPALKA